MKLLAQKHPRNDSNNKYLKVSAKDARVQIRRNIPSVRFPSRKRLQIGIMKLHAPLKRTL